MPVASIKFTQGINTDLPGRALVGITGSLVTITNGDNTGVTSYRISLLDKPLGSALVEGILVDAVGPIPSASFTPDVSGTYQIQLRLNGDDNIIDIRDFIVPNSLGWYVPAANSTINSFNYSGQVKGWKTALNTIINDLVAAAGGAVNFAAGVQDLPGLRAIVSASRVDRQVRLVEDAGTTYRYDANTGAGVADDSNFVIKPNDVLLASNGRWYKMPATAIVEFIDKLITIGYVAGPNAPVPTVIEGIAAFRGDISGTLRDRASMVWEETTSRWRAALVAPNDTTITGGLAFQATDLYSTALTANRLPFVTSGGRIETPTSLTTTQGLNFQSTVEMDRAQINIGEIKWATIFSDFATVTEPEGNLTAPFGSLARSNQSVGKVWIKRTGTGNTGWFELLPSNATLIGDVTGTLGNNRVEKLSGDSLGNIVDASVAKIRMGIIAGSSAYAASGNIRVTNHESFEINVRNGFQVAGTGDTSLLAYSPGGGGAWRAGVGFTSPAVMELKAADITFTAGASNFVAIDRGSSTRAIDFLLDGMRFAQNETASINQVNKTSDVAPLNFTIRSQGPFAGATTNTTAKSGDILLTTPNGVDVGQGEQRGRIISRISGVDVVTVNYTGIRTRNDDNNMLIAPLNSTSGAGGWLNIRGGQAHTSGNHAGGYLFIKGGGGNGTADDGSVVLQSGGESSTMLEVFETTGGPGRRILSLVKNSLIAGTDVPTGDLLLHVGNAATQPTSAPVTGFNLWGSSGVTWFEYSDGNIHRSDIGGITDIELLALNVTLTRSEYRNGIIRITNSNDDNNLIFPNLSGRMWFVINDSGSLITLKTSPQSGAPTITAGSKLVIACVSNAIIVVR
jgi:hypothetical protein